MMKNISQDISGDFGVVEEPKIENRRELHQFLGSVMVETHELKRCQSTDATTVKTYLIESHTPPTPLTLAGYRVNTRKTNDSLAIVTFRKINAKKSFTLYIDTTDVRFWTIHTVEKSAVVDPFIDGIVQNEMEKDYAWFPRPYLERFRERISQGAAVHRDSPCILNNGYKGKFTARGHSIDRYLDLIQSVKQDYADTITYLENEIIGPRAAVTISFSSPLEDLTAFTSEVNSCTYPFLFLGFPRYEFDDFRALTGIDLHTGGKLNLELSPDWIRMYLIKGLCGNTVVRFYSVVQHVYDSDAELGGAEHGKLF